MINVDNYNKVKEIEERINKEGINKVIEDLMKNPYREKSKFDKVLS